jgi:hypothetical protein
VRSAQINMVKSLEHFKPAASDGSRERHAMTRGWRGLERANERDREVRRCRVIQQKLSFSTCQKHEVRVFSIHRAIIALAQYLLY